MNIYHSNYPACSTFGEYLVSAILFYNSTLEFRIFTCAMENGIHVRVKINSLLQQLNWFQS